MPAPSSMPTTTANTAPTTASETTPAQDAPPGWFDPAAMGASNALAGMLMAGGILIITFILMARLRNKQRMRPSTLTTTDQIAQIRARAGDSRTFDAFKADAHDFTRQMAALLDSKAERLEQLIADADDRLRRLDAIDRSGDNHASGDQALAHDRTHDRPNTRNSAHDRDAASERSRDPAARRSPPDLEPSDSLDPLHDRIHRLADSGLDPVAIARETGQPTGQIELILALRG